MQELCYLLIRFKCWEELYEHSGNKDNIIILLLIKLGLTHQLVDIVKVLNVRYNWLWIIKMGGWNSVKCDILSDPMHVREFCWSEFWNQSCRRQPSALGQNQLLPNYWGHIWTKIIHNVAEAFPQLCYSWFVQPFKGL